MNRSYAQGGFTPLQKGCPEATKAERFVTGFSLIEVLAVLVILGILFLIAVRSFSGATNSKVLSTSADALVSVLERAKADAVSGKNGLDYGVKFNTDSYVYFEGDTYDPDAVTNIVHTLDERLELSNTITDPYDSVVFSRISGDASEEATVTLYRAAEPSDAYVITIGALGDVTLEPSL